MKQTQKSKKCLISWDNLLYKPKNNNKTECDIYAEIKITTD